MTPNNLMCYNILQMKKVSVRDMRAMITNLDDAVATEGEILVTRRGKPIARVVPFRKTREVPSHAKLRNSMGYMKKPSADHIRADRDARE